MGLFDKIHEPIMLKEGDSLKKQLSSLEELYTKATGELKEKIGKEIYAVKAGISGENQIIYELKNSHMPMYIIQDWNIALNDKKSQIDFVVVTRGKTFIIECKNLWGDITVDNKGQFVRKFNYGKYYNKEAMYSPIEQNRKHLELLKEIIKSHRNFIQRNFVDDWFPKIYQGVVVMANPKMVVDYKYAPKEIKQQLVRADGLVEYIKKVNSSPDVNMWTEKEFTQLANSIVSQNTENETDYTEKYREALSQQSSNKSEVVSKEPTCPLCGGKLIKRVAKKGSNSGNVFYGCENYPKCHGILSSEQYEKMSNL